MVIRTDEQWLDLFSQHETSGLNMAEFCRRNDLNPKYFSLRRKQFGLKTKAKRAVKSNTTESFIKVAVEKSDSGGVVIEYGSVKLSFGELPPVSWVVELLKTS
ncbi:MAG: hypothetical protein KDI59_01445 [Xanthomonadales bacterium]|jgi:hypothetical protein|nr:hypothetical protein [Xanthomonadales bacterium]